LEGGAGDQRARDLHELLARFATNELARLAQFWVGDYYMRHENYVSAQSEYQRIVESQSWPVTNLTYRARLAAGQAAFKRQGWGAAMGHFTNLVNDVVNCPADVAAEALYALGDTLINNTDPGRTLDRFAEAKKLFEKIPQLFETNALARHLVPAALGRIGDCALQLAVQDPSQYAAATNAYWRVVTNSAAGGNLRGMAAFGIGRACEAQAAGSAPEVATNLIAAAFDQYYSVVTGSGPLTLVQPDPEWVRDAGLAGIRIAEERGQWQLAARLYERIAAVLPALKARLQDRIDKARDKARLEGG
jgi:tetratricopeptide (TPR) repeat protein